MPPAELGELVHSFPRDEGAVLFIDTFFETILREWHGIDRLRLDKYYFLVSQVVKQGIARVIMVGVPLSSRFLSFTLSAPHPAGLWPIDVCLFDFYNPASSVVASNAVRPLNSALGA